MALGSLQDRYLKAPYEVDNNTTAVRVVNPDGTEVGTTPVASTATTVNSYSEALSVSASSTTDIVSYTVPAGKTFYLSLVEFSGENIADFEVLEDSTVIAKKRTYFGGNLCGEFLFEKTSFNAGTIVKLRVINFRSSSADFEGRINGLTL